MKGITTPQHFESYRGCWRLTLQHFQPQHGCWRLLLRRNISNHSTAVEGWKYTTIIITRLTNATNCNTLIITRLMNTTKLPHCNSTELPHYNSNLITDVLKLEYSYTLPTGCCNTLIQMFSSVYDGYLRTYHDYQLPLNVTRHTPSGHWSGGWPIDTEGLGSSAFFFYPSLNPSPATWPWPPAWVDEHVGLRGPGRRTVRGQVQRFAVVPATYFWE